MKRNRCSGNRSIVILLGVLLFCNCKSKNYKGHYKMTVPICNRTMYVEMYTMFGSGAFGGDLIDEYLTDSTSFRVRIGTFDDYNEKFHYKCIGVDSVAINKMHMADTARVYHVVETNTYNIKVLQKLQNISSSKIVNITSNIR